MCTAKAYLGLGSNQDDPVQHVMRACSDIDHIHGVELRLTSSLYQSAPFGPQDQPDFINAVVEIDTTLNATQLLTQLQLIEQRHGRIKQAQRWGPRPLDIDLLLFDQIVINSETLKIPHPGLYDRAFVLYPLQEIAPQVVIPGKGTLNALIKRCDKQRIEKLSAIKAFAQRQIE